jgi:hypothetical protein
MFKCVEGPISLRGPFSMFISWNLLLPNVFNVLEIGVELDDEVYIAFGHEWELGLFKVLENNQDTPCTCNF